MNCPAHKEELVERIIWNGGRKVGRLFYCPHEGCDFTVTPPKGRTQTRRAGQTAIDGGGA